MFQGIWTTGLTWSSRASSGLQRHKTDFEVLEEIGSGGFGRVFRVKHKLDRKEYALKVVQTSSSSKELEKIVREVQVLASIQNQHVVRYFSAWLEPGDLARGSLVDNSHDSGTDLSSGSFFSTQETTNTRHMHLNTICNLCRSSYKDWEVSLEQWGLIDAVLQPLNLCVDCYKKSVPPDADISGNSIRETQVLPNFLYILMEYCESTLGDAVKEIQQSKSADADAKIWDLFGQILEGFAHLHTNGVIHRDVKPSNIFVHDNTVKIGDLGLATTFSRSDSETGFLNNNQGGSGGSKSSEVGTVLYMAPEVSAGKFYNEKSDVFSLGIVLVEIFNSFSTGMERVKVLQDARHCIFSEEWVALHPVAHNLAQRMLHSKSEDPSARPSCFDVLEELMAKDLCKNQSMKGWVVKLQNQVRTLQERLKSQDEEIARLQKLLKDHGI